MIEKSMHEVNQKPARGAFPPFSGLDGHDAWGYFAVIEAIG
jgi:hypothetical protein